LDQKGNQKPQVDWPGAIRKPGYATHWSAREGISEGVEHGRESSFSNFQA